MKILFFIGSLQAGGKERRLVELLSYLNSKESYDILLVLATDKIEYPKFQYLNIKHIDLHKRANSKSFFPMIQLLNICARFRPDVIHTWGSLQTLYSVPSSLLLAIPILNNQIADVFTHRSLLSRLMNSINFFFSSIICSNSYAGLVAYGVSESKKSVVISNGIDISRFSELDLTNAVKKRFLIHTSYAVVMAASYSKNKDWNRFYELASYVTKIDNNISFIGVGSITDSEIYSGLLDRSSDNPNIIIQGRTSEVENLVNACDIGVLFSTKGEGISNTILEYLALGKAVIVDELGGSSEFIDNNVNGFFTTGKTISDIGNLIIELINTPSKRIAVGNRGKETVLSRFSLPVMGEQFEKLYRRIVK